MNKKYIIILFALGITFGSNCIEAQIKNSVYSMQGIGQLSDYSFGVNRSLGGTGIAFQSRESINYLNPASYIGLAANSNILEAGVYTMFTKSQSNSASQYSSEFNFDYVSISFYFTNWWASSLGITPFSYVDYEIDSKDEIDGEPISIDKNYSGSGGLNRIYFGNSFNIFKGLSIGFNASYIVGPITQTEIAHSNESFSGYELQHKLTASSFYLDYGMQYSINNDNWLYTIGLIYGSSETLNTTDELEFIYNGISTSLEQDDESLKLPEKFGIGISLKNGNNFRAGLDYEWGSWSSINYSNSNFNTKNSNRYSIGVEYKPEEDRRGGWLNDLTYRLGANYKNSYLEIDNTQINSMAINLGLGIPYETFGNINLSFEYGEEGTLSNGLIMNSYLKFYLNISLPEFWSNNSSF
jgi:hypothetical protein